MSRSHTKKPILQTHVLRKKQKHPFLQKRTFTSFLAKSFAFAKSSQKDLYITWPWFLYICRTAQKLTAAHLHPRLPALLACIHQELPIFISKVTQGYPLCLLAFIRSCPSSFPRLPALHFQGYPLCLLGCLHSSGSGTDLGYWEQVETETPMPWTSMFSFIWSLFVNFVKLFKFTGIQTSEYSVNFNAENGGCQIEMDLPSNNSLVSQASHQALQPTLDGLNRTVANEEHEDAGAEINGLQQIEIGIPKPSFQLDQSQSTQTMDGQDVTFKDGMQVALWATSISASGVIAVWTGFLVNQPDSPMCKFFAKAASLSMSASFSFGLLILILSIMRPKFHATAMIVKILMFAAIGSTTLVVGFGVVFYFVMSG